jgi:hypothetical protein
VSQEELEDIVATRKFRTGPNSLEGKWFSDSRRGAIAHAKVLYPDGDYDLVEADVPDSAPSLFRLANLDGLGPARYLHVSDLGGVVPRKSNK